MLNCVLCAFFLHSPLIIVIFFLLLLHCLTVFFYLICFPFQIIHIFLYSCFPWIIFVFCSKSVKFLLCCFLKLICICFYCANLFIYFFPVSMSLINYELFFWFFLYFITRKNTVSFFYGLFIILLFIIFLSRFFSAP